MTKLTPPPPKPVTVAHVDRVTTLTLWLSFVLAFIVILVLLFPIAWLRRWRSSLALLLSADVFYEVIQNRNGSDEQQTESVDTVCYVQKKLISATAKQAFYNTYILTLPLHIGIMGALIIQRIFSEEFTSESCFSLMRMFANDPKLRDFYDCAYRNGTTQSRDNHMVLTLCGNSSLANSSRFDENISCTQYFFDWSKVFETIPNIVVWQALLAKISVYTIRWMRYVYICVLDKCYNWYLGGFILFHFLIVTIPLAVVLMIIGIYLGIGDIRLKSDHSRHVIGYTFFVLYSINFILSLSIQWQRQAYEEEQETGFFHTSRESQTSPVAHATG